MNTSQTLAQHGWWLASRASGVVALALVTISVGIGLAMAGKFAKKPGANKTLVAIHEQTALAGLVAIAVHGLTLLGDPWLNPGLAGIAIPFTMAYKSVFTGLGIIGGWLAALLGLSFYVRQADRPGLLAQGPPRHDRRLRPRRDPHAGRRNRRIEPLALLADRPDGPSHRRDVRGASRPRDPQGP